MIWQRFITEQKVDKKKAPVIIRTRGHRLEGIWHSGSPMAGIINLVKVLMFWFLEI